jgi:TPR repeat protein
MFDNGEGVRKSDKKALYWYQKSAEQGFASAQINLGVKYLRGEGVDQDVRQAYVYFSLAAE